MFFRVYKVSSRALHRGGVYGDGLLLPGGVGDGGGHPQAVGDSGLPADGLAVQGEGAAGGGAGGPVKLDAGEQ